MTARGMAAGIKDLQVSSSFLSSKIVAMLVLR